MLSRKIARSVRALTWDQLPPEVIEKVKLALLDYLSCVFEASDTPASKIAIQTAAAGQGTASIIGTQFRAAPAEAAFANAVLGHGLVREDMHTGSVSHLGVVVLPALLAFVESGGRAGGRDLVVAAVCGYETGAAIGNALMDAATVRMHRPTGITGTIGGAAAGARLLNLSEDQIASAIGFAANATVGLNEWPQTGADDMFFHAGFAARNAVTSVQLAQYAGHASETALDGRAGLFAAVGRAERASEVELFRGGRFEILAVYHKPAPACNYAQTACQAAFALVNEDGVDSRDVTSISVQVSAAALNYPGCNAPGPFERILQAKMSIHFCTAATLSRGTIEEANYRQLDDREIARLISVMKVEEDPAFTAAYPGKQGTEVSVTLQSGVTVTRRLDDVTPAAPELVRLRFRLAAASVLGKAAGTALGATIENLEDADLRELTELVSLAPQPAGR